MHAASLERGTEHRAAGGRGGGACGDVCGWRRSAFGQTQTKLLELVAIRERRTPTTRETARMRYLRTLERVLVRSFADLKADGFRTAMDLERSFGPAYARGSLVRGQQAWAVIAVNEEETRATVDGILTLGVLWLHHCRENAGGRRLYQGLRLIVPRGMATLTLSRHGVDERMRRSGSCMSSIRADRGAGAARCGGPRQSADAAGASSG